MSASYRKLRGRTAYDQERQCARVDRVAVGVSPAIISGLCKTSDVNRRAHGGWRIKSAIRDNVSGLSGVRTVCYGLLEGISYHGWSDEKSVVSERSAPCLKHKGEFIRL